MQDFLAKMEKIIIIVKLEEEVKARPSDDKVGSNVKQKITEQIQKAKLARQWL